MLQNGDTVDVKTITEVSVIMRCIKGIFLLITMTVQYKKVFYVAIAVWNSVCNLPYQQINDILVRLLFANITQE